MYLWVYAHYIVRLDMEDILSPQNGVNIWKYVSCIFPMLIKGTQGFRSAIRLAVCDDLIWFIQLHYVESEGAQGLWP